MSENVLSDLVLETLVFDKISFTRLGLKNDNNVDSKFSVRISFQENGVYRVTIGLVSEKEEEYKLEISLSGFFTFKNDIKDELKNELLRSNAVAILLPYLRSEATLITSQPETDSLILPIFDINKILEQNK